MDYLKTAQNVLKLEASAIEKACQRLSEGQLERLVLIFKTLKQSGGSLIFTGVGKSGFIAQKLAATFSSLGLPSFFLHPVEALHGDLGRVTTNDALVMISKSGNTEEILKLLPYIDIPTTMKIGLLGKVDSPLTPLCDLVFDCSVEKEACLNNQAPTTSSTVALAVGDALAVVYESLIGISKESFAQNHPGGILGKTLRLKVENLMWSLADCPLAKSCEPLKEIILKMTNKPIGGCAIIDDAGKLIGILVEGDIRRTFTRPNMGLDSKAAEIMNKNPVTILPTARAIEALELMEKRKSPIALLPVVDENNKFIGMLRLHDLYKEGLK